MEMVYLIARIQKEGGDLRVEFDNLKREDACEVEIAYAEMVESGMKCAFEAIPGNRTTSIK